MLPDLRVAKAIELNLEPLPRPCPGGIDFTHPDFALMCARTGLGTGTQAWFYVSSDRAHTWQGPYSLPLFGQPGIEARTDYLVDAPGDCILFLTASREDGDEGAGVLMARTADGGQSFNFVSWVAASADVHRIMPSSIRLDANTLLSAIRSWPVARPGPAVAWIDLYRSSDNGTTWRHLNRPVPDAGKGGNPPAMVKLKDGRVCLTYGYRATFYC